MSSGNEQNQNKTSEGVSVMEASQTQCKTGSTSDGDGAPQAKDDKQNQDENNSNASLLSERPSTETSVKQDVTSTPQPVQAVVAKDDVNDADGGAVPSGTQTQNRGEEPSAMDQSVPVVDTAQVEQMDLDVDAQPITQPESVELPPLDQTRDTSKLSQSSEKTDNVAKPDASSDVNGKTQVGEMAPGSVVELPPLDQAGGTSAASASTSGAKDENSGQSVYYIKWIHYKQNKVPIITQNENGPCPLLAIMNVLLLKGKVKLAPMIEMITSEQLMTYLGESILDSMPEKLSESVRANYEQNMQDAMSVMYKLQTGLDVNVKFTGVADFEYTSECIIFDLLSIPLYHGWLVDPQDPVCTSSVGSCSYNQLVEKIIAQKSSEKEENVHEALVAEQFLDRTASQLTYYGLCELSTSVKEGELCIFFRNNHFSTLHRMDNELFLLVTDQGFLTECNVVWETLSNVEGDCHFVDTNFRTYTKPEPTGNIAASPIPVGSDQQIDQDYQVALSLQHENEMREEQEVAWGHYTQVEGSALQMADHELARRLQEEEDRRAAAAVNASQQRAAQQQGQGQGQAQGQAQGGQGHPPQAAAAHSSNSRQGRGEGRQREEKKDKDCTIL